MPGWVLGFIFFSQLTGQRFLPTQQLSSASCVLPSPEFKSPNGEQANSPAATAFIVNVPNNTIYDNTTTYYIFL